MSRPVLYVAITNHGFGHATRTAALVAEIQRQCPEILLALVTTAPRWLLESYIGGDFIYRPRGLDVGVVQSDSLTMDKPATLEKLQQIQAQQQALIQAEVTFIEQNKVGLVLADIPPLAAAIASRANIPCWMTSNFGWDFIYRTWGGEFAAVADWIADCFGQCSQLFRLPFHEPMSAFPKVIDVGLTGGTPKFALADLREKFNLHQPPERTVLLSFGGLGIQQVPYHNLERFPDWQFISFDRDLPDLPHLVQISDRTYRPVDFMPLCSRIVSKPGYSTFAEACQLGLPIATVTRSDFAEAQLLLDGIQNHAHHQILTPEEFFQGDWSFLADDPTPPKTNEALPTGGNQAIGQAVIEYLNQT